MLKRVAIMLFCLIIVFIATFGFVVGVVAVPTIYTYATVDDDSIYVPLRDPSDAVIAFQAYCKSRDLTIEGSLTDAVTTFTTGAFNSACNEIGINVTQLQSEIKAEYDQAGKPVKFLLNDTGVMAMNRIFAQFLQDNELEVGDSANQQNNTVYSGYLIVDDDNNTALAYVLNTGLTSANGVTSDVSNIVQEGTPIRYDVADLKRLANNGNTSFTINYNNSHYNFPLGKDGDLYYFVVGYFPNILSNGIASPSSRDGYTNIKGFGIPCFIITPDNVLRICRYSHFSALDGSTVRYWYKQQEVSRVSNNSQPANVYITTNNTVINNNTYEGDTIINNDGDVIVEPDPVPPGGTDPGWDIGGGGGTATDGNGNTWNIQFPDFELPDLNIDWSINGLGEKFPFSIPFDLVALVTVLNAEPQAPRFEGTVNFGFTTWNYDINLQQFDSVAQACRIAELLLLVVGLILVTRSIIKG